MKRVIGLALLLTAGCDDPKPSQATGIAPVVAAPHPVPVDPESQFYPRIERGHATPDDVASLLQEVREEDPPITFARLKKNADKYDGSAWRCRGKILEIGESGGRTKMRLALDDYGANVIFVEAPFETEFVEDDVVDVVGVLKGSLSYQSQAGWNITIPAMLAAKIAKRGGLDVKAPAPRKRRGKMANDLIDEMPDTPASPRAPQ